MGRVIPVLDIYEYSPWDLPQYAGEYSHRDPEQWFFFIPRQESEARGGRPKRLTTAGYWKATGSPGYVYSSNNRCIAKARVQFLCRVYKKSKCLRSFDRRPIGVEIGQRRAQKSQSDEGKSKHSSNPAMVETRSSPESSSSGDHGCFNQTGEGSSMPMASLGNDPLWDLDQLHNWFCGGDDM
ncbi:hypothetical protein GH714_010712 [Hevea brasiliensis]|uniref:NAC domain-containing protein n=1 Tax=Hevea brasiliensis TaxID=3981 RepID=A0A6A6KIF0_HEVBR|nr:hypothetical protein GH714_010712 [Hevea brasiliensis]